MKEIDQILLNEKLEKSKVYLMVDFTDELKENICE